MKRTLAEGETVDFGLIWTDELALGDFITASTWDVGDLTDVNSFVNEDVMVDGEEIPVGHLASVTVTGSEANRSYLCRNTVETNRGLTLVRDILIHGIKPGVS